MKIAVILISSAIFVIGSVSSATAAGTTCYFGESISIAGITMTHHLPIQPGDYFLIGQAWGDYEGDGWLDLYLTDAAGPNKLFNNNGDGTFTGVISFPQILLTDTLSSGANFVDVDNDGWFDIELIGAAPINGPAIGSRVYLTMTIGLSRMQEVKNGSSLGAGNSLALHFGLDDEDIVELRIDWSDGGSTYVDGVNLPVNTYWYHQYPRAGCNQAVTVSDGVQQIVSAGGKMIYTHTVRNNSNCRDGFFINWESTSDVAFAMPAFLWLDPGESGQIAVNVVVNGHLGDETIVLVGSILDESIAEVRTNQTAVNLSQQYLPFIQREN